MGTVILISPHKFLKPKSYCKRFQLCLFQKIDSNDQSSFSIKLIVPMQTGSDEFRISHMPDVILSYHMQRIFTPWCQNSYPKGPIFNLKTFSIAMGTTLLQY